MENKEEVNSDKSNIFEGNFGAENQTGEQNNRLPAAGEYEPLGEITIRNREGNTTVNVKKGIYNKQESGKVLLLKKSSKELSKV